MRRTLVVALAVALALSAMAGIALAAGYDAPVGGTSPHAGWTTTSDQCKYCHAVHKATGNRFLLRSSNSRYNDCAYCHLDGSGGAGFDVYTNSLFNGHTSGALGGKDWLGGARTARRDNQGRVIVPDKEGSTTNYRGGGVIQQNSTTWIGYGTTTDTPMYRTRSASGAISHYDARYESTFNCNACHMAHANPEKIVSWRFLSLNPNARTRNATGLYMYYGPEWPNYKVGGSRVAAADARTSAGQLTNKILLRDPTDGSANSVYEYSDSGARGSGSRLSAVTQWCADCHNLNVMGPGMKDVWSQDTSTTTLGFEYYASRSSGGYFSHSTYYNFSGLTRLIAGGYKADDGANYKNTTTAGAPACYDCHVGYGASTVPVDNGGANKTAGNYNDWPHTGSRNSYALLKTIPKRMAVGGGSANPSDLIDIEAAGADPYSQDAATQGAGLDNVCRQCHAVGNRDPGSIWFDNTEGSGVFTNTWPSPGP